MSVLVQALSACLLWTLAAAAGADATDRPTSAVLARALMAEVLAADRGPGLQAAVVRDGVVLFAHALGKAHVELDVALTTSHRQRIGSVSKPITATLLLRLAQMGVLALDDGVRGLVPSLPGHYEGITLRHLASHTAGVRHYDFANFAEANNMLFQPTLADAIGSWAEEPLLCDPGTQFHYSSLGYNLLGVAIEQATAVSYAAALERYLAGPLGLDDLVVDHPLQLTPGRAAHYTVTYANPVFPWMEDGQTVNTIFRDSSDYYPSGGLLASASALARFVDAVMTEAGPTRGQRAALITPARLSDGAEARFAQAGADAFYGLGWTIVRDSDDAIVWLGHDGETNGAYALVRHFPATGISVAAIANYNIVAREPLFFEFMGKRLPALFASAGARLPGPR